MIAITQTVREIALENPASIRIFERLGIDYCCGGRKPLAEACEEKNIPLSDVIAALETRAVSDAPATQNWISESLGLLTEHIVNPRHAYVRRELPRLVELSGKVFTGH